MPPLNDAFQSPTTLQPLTTVAIAGTNVEASEQPDEPLMFDTVWYRWTAPQAGTYRVEVCGSSFNTNLRVVVGTILSQVEPVAENNDAAGCGPDGKRSSLTFSATQAQDYRLQVGSAVNAVNGTISGSIALLGGPGPPTPPVPPLTPDIDPPETTISNDVKRSETGKVKFRFASNEPAASFECKLKGPDLEQALRQFRGCEAPRKYTGLDEGRYTFKVRAVDTAGNVDPTPASDQFRVVP